MTDQMQALLKQLGSGRGVDLGRLPVLLAELHGDKRAVHDPSPSPGIHEGGWRSYNDMAHTVSRYAAAHEAAGVARDQRVLIILGNRIDITLHAMAMCRLGAVPTLVNGYLKSAEMAAVGTATDSTFILVDDDIAERLEQDGVLGDATWLRTGNIKANADSLAGWLQANPGAVVEQTTDRDPDETALFLTTSGTTGVPKPAALSSRGLLETPGRLSRLPVGRSTWPRADRDLMMAALPLSHVMGLGLSLGAQCAGVPVMLRPRFDPVEMLDLIEEHRPNVFIGVPTMYADLEAAGCADRDLSSIQLFASSADAMPTERARRFQKYGSWWRIGGKGRGAAIFVDGYGMVELSGAGAIRLYAPGWARLKLPAVAKVVPGLEVRCVDEDGNEVPRGKVGELQFRGPAVLDRYEGHDSAGPDADGWLSSGDHARLYPGGVFSFAGRQKDRLKIGGFSVFPAEVEQELAKHPNILEVAMVGVPDERLGERPVALYIPKGELDPGDFVSWAAEHVAGYRAPRSAHIVDEIPRGNNNKVDRNTATEIAERLES